MKKRLETGESDRQGAQKMSAMNVHGIKSNQQPTANSSVIPPAMFLGILFDWPEFCDAYFIATLTKTDEILNGIVDALLAKTYDPI